MYVHDQVLSANTCYTGEISCDR